MTTHESRDLAGGTSRAQRQETGIEPLLSIARTAPLSRVKEDHAPSVPRRTHAAARGHARHHGRNRRRHSAVLAAREEPRGSLNPHYEIPLVRLRRRMWLLWTVVASGFAVGAYRRADFFLIYRSEPTQMAI